MTSILVAYALFCAIFWGVHMLRNEEKQVYSVMKRIVFYLGTRVYPAFMLNNKKVWAELVVEFLIVIVFLYVIGRKKEKTERGEILACYLFQPLTIYYLATGKPVYLILSGVVLIVLFLASQQLWTFFPEYVLLGIGAWTFLFSVKVLKQKPANILKTDDIPMVCILGIAVMSLALFCIVVHIIRKKSLLMLPTQHADEKKHQWLDNEAIFDRFHKEAKSARMKFSLKDIGFILLFTVIFMLMVFHDLGSHEAPETYETMDVKEGKNNIIILNFDHQVNVSKLWIFLGNESKRDFSFTYWDEGDTKWNEFASSHIIHSVFCWNGVDVNHTLNSLGIVLMKDTAYLNEIVIVDTEGNRVLPSNASDFPNLFDEQETFSKVPSYYNGTMFDEVYHARTAYEFLHKLPIYENTHPPLGKTIISLGIHLFGMNPFGWRFMCAVCGTIMISFFYVFAHRMLGGDHSCLLYICFNLY